MSLNLPPGPFGAYLFDCDGTIADSMPLHYIAWSTALGEQGCPFPEDLFYAWGGWPVAKIIDTLNHTHSLHMPIDLVAHRKERSTTSSCPRSTPSPRSSSRSNKTSAPSPSL